MPSRRALVPHNADARNPCRERFARSSSQNARGNCTLTALTHHARIALGDPGEASRRASHGMALSRAKDLAANVGSSSAPLVDFTAFADCAFVLTPRRLSASTSFACSLGQLLAERFCQAYLVVAPVRLDFLQDRGRDLLDRLGGRRQPADPFLGADHVVLSTDQSQMLATAGQFALIIDTVPYVHDLNPCLPTLATGGALVLVGFLGELDARLNTAPLVMNRNSVAGSLIGGIAETQELLDFCGEHAITSDIEVIKIQDINEAYERMLKSDVKYRFVIDMATPKA
jgi:hypothetical protein